MNIVYIRETIFIISFACLGINMEVQYLELVRLPMLMEIDAVMFVPQIGQIH